MGTSDRRPLRVNRRSLRRNGEHPRLPWVFRCGCGLRSQVNTFERGLSKIRYHDCNDYL